MTVPQLHAPTTTTLCLESNPSWWDPDSGCTIVIAQPHTEPELWNDYVRGAEHSYRNHGVERALDMRALRSGADTAMFCVGLDDAGDVIGGLRCKGPYDTPEECHAVLEWAGQPGLSAVHKMVSDRLPFGVVEMKTAWVADDADQGRALADLIARIPLHAMKLLDSQFAVATAASYVLKRWLSSGGVMASKIPATPYPDERYQTKMMWWDSMTFAEHADPKQRSTYFAESRRMVPRREYIDELRVPVELAR